MTIITIWSVTDVSGTWYWMGSNRVVHLIKFYWIRSKRNKLNLYRCKLYTWEHVNKLLNKNSDQYQFNKSFRYGIVKRYLFKSISRWTSTIIKEPYFKFCTDFKKGLWGDETLEIWPQAIQFDPLFLHVDVVVDNVSFQIKEFKSLFNLRIGFKKKIKNNRSVTTFSLQ